tara:strand:+ start:281 stop:577 length:297 start_codon:yes stop_codon:yes gene_type:complete
MDEINAGEIVYADVTLLDEKDKKIELRKVVFSREWKCNFPHLETSHYHRFLKQNSIKGNAKIISLKILSRTGFKHKNKGYTNAKKSDQVRDNVTGAYV